jgi:uncharacterized protein (TIGR00369 family)
MTNQLPRPADQGPPTQETAQQVLSQQPFSRLLGTRLTTFSHEGATLELEVRDEHLQQHGYVHGGVISYLVDNAITFAAGAVLGPDVVTGGFTLDYLTPTSGPLLRAQASVCRAGGKTAVMRCDLHAVQADDSCILVAVGQGRAQVRRS